MLAACGNDGVVHRHWHVVRLTDSGAERLNEAECPLAAAEDEVLGALDPAERDSRYELLRRATSGASVTCVEPTRDDPGTGC
ncbi:hypothetical protein [Micromonospora sp. NPDC023956]|uniref:hypothetical protein n=1 Tax=Micromonospora sp. NPDC023956 TaxID=3155722 RepID=UPI0033DBCB29